MTTKSKPKWVEALESAEQVAAAAAACETTDEQSSLNAVAHTWLAIAREYREGADRGLTAE